jgi:hypothetical protein
MFCIAKSNPQGLIDASVTSFFQKRAYYQRRKKIYVKVKFVSLGGVPTNATSTLPSRALSRSGSPIPRSGSPIPTHPTSRYDVSGSHFGGGGGIRVGGDVAGDRGGKRGVALRRLPVAKVPSLESPLCSDVLGNV